jgi:hypothetical protein
MRLWLCFAILIASTASAYATPGPEVDVSLGLAALGVVGSIVTLMWERNRRK